MMGVITLIIVMIRVFNHQDKCTVVLSSQNDLSANCCEQYYVGFYLMTG